VIPETTLIDAFAADVVRDLRRAPKQLQSRYLYDPLGSSLFEAICRLPWYRITRAEAGLLEQHARDVAAALPVWREAPTIVELGCGNGEKLEVVLSGVPDVAVDVHLIDISADALEMTAVRLARRPAVIVSAHEAPYEIGLERVRPLLRGRAGTLVLFLGSNIGNFDRAGAESLLRSIRQALEPGAALLLGTDLVKPRPALLLAYDDPLGVTAAFNKNLLVRINRELAADFDLDAFDHRAIWNDAEHRIEMHLVSRQAQEVRLSAASVRIGFEAGESIWTESSYKYTEAEIAGLGRAAGLSILDQWVDPDAAFALTLFQAV
jgi:dimethylhistidine N-methyltransferase